MLVYRVEHIDGHGPYRLSQYRNDYDNPIWSLKDRICWAHDTYRHPTPREDGIPFINEDEFCGFDSLEKLKSWFAGFLRDLRKHNFRVAVYNTDDIKFGEKQVVFKKQGEPVCVLSTLSRKLPKSLNRYTVQSQTA